jgi:uncharacterized protein YlxW (UPF0749 family)
MPAGSSEGFRPFISPIIDILEASRNGAGVFQLHRGRSGRMTDTKSAETQIKEAVWTYGGWFVLLSLTLGAGVMLAYIFWGDAPRLRAENADLNKKVSAARADRENVQTQLTMTQEEVARCQRKLAAASPSPTQ